MSFQLTIGGTVIPTDSSVFKSFRDDLNLAFALDQSFHALPGTTALSSIPPANATSSVSYQGPPMQCAPAAGPVTFGLQAGASGSVEILQAGASLLTFSSGLDTPETESIPVPAGLAYVKLTLHLTLSGNVSQQWSSGAYGVKSSAAGEQTFAITYAKAFPPATPLHAALADTFKGFVLPLHPETLQQLDADDHLQYSFDGNLHLAFGAYTGFDQVLYAGQTSWDILQTQGSPLATLSLGVSPEIKADVALDFTCTYTAQFEASLLRDANAAHLHLFRASTVGNTTTVGATLSVEGNVSANIATHTDTLRTRLLTACGGATTPKGKAIAAAFDAAGGELDKYGQEFTDKLTTWLNPANGTIDLQASIEQTHARTVLAAYTFDLANPQWHPAWNHAVAGDLLASLRTGAVLLDPGSGLEQEYRRKTACQLNLFNAWHWQATDSSHSTLHLLYAGNNRFHLAADVGRTVSTDATGPMHKIDFYFAAMAGVDANGAATAEDLTLHINLNSTSDRKECARIAALLDSIGDARIAPYARLAHNFSTRNDAVVSLAITLPAAALQALRSDPPGSTSTANDQNNWNAFAVAADSIPGAWALQDLSGYAQRLKTYEGWQDLNVTCIGKPPADRTRFGARAWPSDFPQDLSDGMQQMYRNSMYAGQAFMNFCADVRSLTETNSDSASHDTWEAFVARLNQAIQNDTSADFLRPTTLALLRLCVSKATRIAGPSSTDVPTRHLAITLDF